LELVVLKFAPKDDPNTCCMRCVNAWLVIDGRFCGLIANCCNVEIGTLKDNVLLALPENALGVNGNGNVCP